jgi:hypothetical protein
MRWQALFGDLEAQLEAASAAELAGEVAERTRIEAGRVGLGDRLAGALGGSVVVAVPGHGPLRGRLTDTGADWLLLEDDTRREALVPFAAVLSVSGLSRAAGTPQEPSRVARALDLRRALRGLVRDRAGVALGLRDGTTVTGTLDRVGTDHVDLAEHPPGEARRAAAVRGVRLVPLTALVVVRSD